MRVPLSLLLSLLLPFNAFASDPGSNSGDSSGDSSAGSDGSSDGTAASGDSSNDSGNSSNNSGDSSNGDSSEQSSEDSSKDSTDGTTDATSRGDSGRAFTVAAAIIVAAGGIACAIGFGVSTTQRSNQDAEKQLSKFLRRHHSAVVHDVVLARGPILRGWAAQWGFTPTEVEHFLTELDGSEEQLALLEEMSKLDDPESARRFAEKMTLVMARAVGQERFTRIAAKT